MEPKEKEKNRAWLNHTHKPSKFSQALKWCKGTKSNLTAFMFAMEFAFIIAFASGCILDPILLQKIWLVFFGTLSVLLGIVIYFIYVDILCTK